MGAVQQPLYGASGGTCNVNQALAYIYAQDDTLIDGFFSQPTQSQIEASAAYAARILFLGECVDRGLVTSECNFETMPLAGSATTLTCPTAGAFASSLTIGFERFSAPADTIPASARGAEVRDLGVGTGRFNAAPANATKPPGQRWIEGSGNAAQFVFASPVIAFGFYFIDTNDVISPVTSHDPYRVILETSAGQLTYDCTLTTNLNFFGVFMATGVTISSARIRWQEYYVPTPGEEDFLGIDGVILANCPVPFVEPGADQQVLFFANYDNAFEGTGATPSSTVLANSRVKAEKDRFLARLAFLGMQKSVADFESQATTSFATTPLSINAAGDFAMTFTAQAAFFASDGATTPTSNSDSRLRGVNFADRYNTDPPAGTKFQEQGGNSARWVFPTPIGAFGVHIAGMGDSGSTALPFTFLLQTSAGPISTSITQPPYTLSPPGKTLWQNDFWFWGITVPAGVTISEVLLRWRNYDAVFFDYISADGIILGRY